jgi:RNA polymerase sigma-70 factor (ECF subfamily)
VTDEQILALYERSLVDVHRAASRLCGGDRAATEELVQDTYLALVRHCREHPGDEVGVGWLVTTCRNRFIDLHRADRRRQRREAVAGARGPATGPGPHDAVGAASGAASGAAADDLLVRLAALPPLQRAALVLRYGDDLPVGEVARIVGKSVHATESLLARGRSALRASSTGSTTTTEEPE